MSIQFNHWLTDTSASRVLLLELEHSTGTKYVSNREYLGTPVSRDNQHRQYEPVLSEAIGMSDRIDSDTAIGDIVLHNDGLLNDWLGYQWSGYSVKGFLGDPSWPRSAFEPVLLATNAGIQSIELGEITLGVQSARTLLETALTTQDVNGAGAPVVIGRVFNATPALVSKASNQYKISALPITAMNAADRGNLGLQESTDLSNGTFTAAATPQGTVTVDVTGTAITAADIARQIAALYSVSVDESTLANLPLWEMGMFYSDGTTTTGAQVLDDVCQTIGGFWRVNHLNQLQVFSLELPQAGTHQLVKDDIERKTLRCSSVEPPLSQITVRYDRNYTVLQAASLASPTVIGADRHQALQQEWQSTTVSPALTGYPAAPKKQYDTQLADQAGAAARTAKINTIRNTRRFVWQLTAFAPGLILEAGNTVFIQTDEYPDFISGRWVTVLANERDLTGETCELEVWY